MSHGPSHVTRSSHIMSHGQSHVTRSAPRCTAVSAAEPAVSAQAPAASRLADRDGSDGPEHHLALTLEASATESPSRARYSTMLPLCPSRARYSTMFPLCPSCARYSTMLPLCPSRARSSTMLPLCPSCAQVLYDAPSIATNSLAAWILLSPYYR